MKITNVITIAGFDADGLCKIRLSGIGLAENAEVISSFNDVYPKSMVQASDSTTGKHLHFREKGVILSVIVKRFTQ